MSLHGTAFRDVGQYNELLDAVLKALPKGTSQFNALALIGTLQKKGAELERELAVLFRNILSGGSWDWTAGRVIEIDNYSADAVREALKEGCFQIGFGMDEVFDGLDFSSIKKEPILVARTVAELGFKYPPCRREIFEEAGRQGYDLCPREIGIVARLQYRDQPRGEVLYVAMEEIVKEWDKRGVLYLHHNTTSGKLELNISYCGPGTAHLPTVKWIFVKNP